MAKVYIDSWSGFKSMSDHRKIGVYAEWNLTNQKVEFQSAKNGALANEVIFEYKISAGSITGKARTTDFALIHTDWELLPVEHKIIIESYENATKEDDESMLTTEAPPL